MDPTLWYFAYGSNLERATFLGRRRMQPLASAIGVLHDYELCFDLPVGPGERGVANVAPRSGEHVWGALYQLAHADAARLDLSEGVDKGVYRRLQVEVVTPASLRVAAFTYRSELSRPERKPSRRYLGLLLAGAREHALPPEWIERLRAWPVAVDERERQLELL
jgi:cation transport regulator ChaC